MKLTINGNEETRFPHVAEEARRIAFEAYASANMFQSVLSDVQPGAIVADAVLENNEVSNTALMFLFIFVATIIPAYVEDNLTLTTTFKNEQGQVLATIKNCASMTTWMELFLIFGMPFTHPSSVMRKLQSELHRETIHEAISLGVFTGSTTPPPKNSVRKKGT